MSFPNTQSHNPDVLSCIANLSNDEVFTPPHIAIAMLDQLEQAWAEAHDGENIWSNPEVTFLDPFKKTGIFLREITSRLNKGLAVKFPDRQERINHILTKQVFGIGITRLTALLARRSVYCSKFANGPKSICTAFEVPAGNIWFEPTRHRWQGTEAQKKTKARKCSYCGAKEKEYSRTKDLETHAYAFIHTDNIQQRLDQIFGDRMHFDVVIGNPPYNLSDGGHGASASPIYHLFVERAFDLDPNYVIMITPSRWFTTGKGLSDFRERMLRDHRLKALVDFPKLYEVFPGVKIRGGVSYFLWDRSHDGPCMVTTIADGKQQGHAVARYLDAYDVLVRSNDAIRILQKLDLGGGTLDEQFSSQKPFGFRTYHHGADSSTELQFPIKFFGSQRITWIERSDIEVNVDWVDQWKVLLTAVQGTSSAVESMFMTRPIIAEPGSACSETYLVAGCFETRQQAENFASYLRTRFVRFLVSLRKTTQHANRTVYSFVPVLSWDHPWTDKMLYEKFRLNDDEIALVESTVRPMENGEE